MTPTLPPGAYVAVSPHRDDAGVGAVVVIRRPDGTEHFKRIVAIEGDSFEAADGRRITVGAGELAVAGDNRSGSTDSRHYGPISREDLVAVARFCYWPPRAWRWLPRGR